MSENNNRERIIQTAMMQLRAEASKEAASIEFCLANPTADSVDNIVKLAKNLAQLDVGMRILQANLDPNQLSQPQSKFTPNAQKQQEILAKAKAKAAEAKKPKKKKDMYTDSNKAAE